MSGLLDVPARWEAAPWMNNSNPPDAINYERPREGFYMSTTPLDLHSIDEGSELTSFMPTLMKKKEEETKEEGSQEDATPAKEEEGESKKEELKTPEDNLIKSFQSFLGASHPIIGKLYNGPIDGKMSPELQAAAKAAEAKIASAIGDTGVNGMILSGSKFVTNPADVKSAIDAIVAHTGKKSSFLPREERILAFSSIIFQK